MVPVAQAVLAPQRRRVQAGFDAFADAAGLTERQRRDIDAAVGRRAEAIQDRIMQGVLSGEVLPGNVTPSSGVAFAHDVLGELDGASHDVRGLLSAGQLDVLHGSRFDVVDYLVFSTRWEDMLGVVE
jgi:hypothetical protein